MNLSFQKLTKLSLISICFVVIISQISVHVHCQNVQQRPNNHKNGLLFHQNNGKFASISSFPAESNHGTKRDLFSSIQENSESVIRIKSKKQQQKMLELEKRRKKRSPFPPGSIDDNLEDAFKEEELIDEEEKQGNSESSPSSAPTRTTGARGNGVNFDEEGITTTEYPSFMEETTTLDPDEVRVKETPPPPTVFTVPPYIPKFKFDDNVSPVDVYVMLNILSVRDIDETLEAMTLEVDLGIEWDDGILFSEMQDSEGTLTKLDASVLNTVWKPDIYIDELLKVTRQSLLNKPIILKFSPRVAEFTYITRLTLQLDCEMSYIYYPADSHLCEFTLRSYSFLSNELRLHWMYTDEGKPHIKLLDPYDPNFDLKVESSNATSQQHAFEKGEYNALKFTILARRKISFHMVQTYLPSVFFIVITWLCFLLPARMVEARIGITMTTLLTLTSMFSAVRESTPIVSYVKAIDLWMVACIFFIFLTLFAFVCLVWLRALREIAEEREKNAYLQDKELNREKKSFGGSRTASIESFELRKYEKLAELIERYTFLILAFLFLLFNVAYWSWLFSASGYYRHNFGNDDPTDHDNGDDIGDDTQDHIVASDIY